jgi:hypothetical protein
MTIPSPLGIFSWMTSESDRLRDGSVPVVIPYSVLYDVVRMIRGNGLFLCATGITHEHPYYNTMEGRLEWNNCQILSQHSELSVDSNDDKKDIVWYNSHTNKVMVSASIEPPAKFQSLLLREEERYKKFQILPLPATEKAIL